MAQKKELKIILYPDAALRKKATAVDRIDEEIFDLSDKMIRLMLDHDGIGLAATQVGEGRRLFVFNATPFEEEPTPVTAINPEIIDAEGRIVEEEGCLSFPHLYLEIARAKRVRLRIQNLFNERLIIDVEDFLAKAVLHEIDHLNGVLFIDHAAEADREKIENFLKGLAVEPAKCE